MASTTGPAVTKKIKTEIARDNQIIAMPANGAVDPAANAAKLNKTSAGAYTLVAPIIEGGLLTITSDTAFAHVVTATGLIQDGTGAAKNTMTFPAFAGASIMLIGCGTKWNVISKNAVTVA